MVALYFPSSMTDASGATTNTETVGSSTLSFIRDIPALEIGKIASVIIFIFVVMAATNGVNLTDGLDGLATGASVMVLAAYALIAFWQYRHWCADPTYTANPDNYCYAVRDPLEIALIAGAAAGACVGFLWWNTSPARIFMGDTGALGLGGLIAGMAMSTRTILLLPIIGGLFVIITMSVVIQIISFRTTGKRVFRMSPLQHHFELAGWSEVNIVVRFWIIAGHRGGHRARPVLQRLPGQHGLTARRVRCRPARRFRPARARRRTTTDGGCSCGGAPVRISTRRPGGTAGTGRPQRR